MGGLCHRVGLDDRRVECLFEFGHHLRGQRCGGGSYESEAGIVDNLFVASGPRQDGLVHRGNGRIPGRVRLFQLREKSEGVEPIGAEDAGSGAERREDGGHQTVDVEERHHVHAAIVGRQAEGGSDVAG